VRNGIRRNVVVLTCAASAGIHAALVPDHLEEGAGAGTGFVVAAVLLGALAVVLTHRPSRRAVAATAAVFAGLLVSYLLVLTTGFPVLHPDVEPVGGLALLTKAVELLGLAAALSLAVPRLPVTFVNPKGRLT
jgi:drug/metabolite transporter (DMT)-like permease